MPDYCRPEAAGDDAANPRASSLELTRFETMRLPTLLERAVKPVGAPLAGGGIEGGALEPHAGPVRAYAPHIRDAALRAAARATKAATVRADGGATATTYGRKLGSEPGGGEPGGGGASCATAHRPATTRRFYIERCLVRDVRRAPSSADRPLDCASQSATVCARPPLPCATRTWCRASSVARRGAQSQPPRPPLPTAAASARSTTATGEDGFEPCFEKVYAYGGDWMLTLPPLRKMADRVRPTFLRRSDYVGGATRRSIPLRPGDKPGAASAASGAVGDRAGSIAGGPAAGSSSPPPAEAKRRLIGARAYVHAGEEDDGCVCWVSSAGCLTPLHYDLDDGLLAQVLGEKRVWLFDWGARDALCLRGDHEQRQHGSGPQAVGLNNWERQSFAELHGARSAAFASACEATRWVADLRPGDLLYIPSGWFHEVHARTPSFSLGWRFSLAVDDDDEPALRRTLAERRVSVGPHHAQTLATLSKLVHVLYKQGRLAEAEPLQRELLRAHEVEHGAANELALSEKANLALCRGRQGEVGEATALLRQALSGMRTTPGGDSNSRTYAMAANLAELLEVQGQYAEAERLYREALAGRRKTLGDRHPATLQLTEALTSLRHRMPTHV